LDSKEISQILLDNNAVKISMDPPFTWTSGIKSPIYCDNRLMIGYTEQRDAIVDGLVDLVKEYAPETEWLAGTATAGIPWAAFVAERMNLPMVYVRSTKKAHGAGKQVEGYMEKGAKVTVVEDLISTGGSSLKSVEALKDEYGADVQCVTAIFSYQFVKADKGFEELGLKYHSLSGLSTMLELLKERGEFTEEQIGLILQFKEDPPAWAEKVGL